MSEPRRVAVTRAFAALVAAFFAAQIGGHVVSGVFAPGVGYEAAVKSGSLDLLARTVLPSMIVSELAIVAVALFAVFDASLPLAATLRLSPAPPRVFAAAAVGTIMLGPLGDVLMSALAEHFPKLTLGVIDALQVITRKLSFALLWPVFAFLPGLAEELLFRGVLQPAFANPRRAVLISGTCFALFHVDPMHVVGVLPLGLFLAWVAQRSSTLVTIVAHVLNNTFALAMANSELADVGYGSNTPVPPLMLAGSVVCVALCAWVIRKATPEPVS